MNEYETKMLRDRATGTIGAGVSVVIISPIFGLLGGALLSSTAAMYVVTAIFAVIGVLAIVGGVREHREIKRKS